MALEKEVNSVDVMWKYLCPAGTAACGSYCNLKDLLHTSRAQMQKHLENAHMCFISPLHIFPGPNPPKLSPKFFPIKTNLYLTIA